METIKTSGHADGLDVSTVEIPPADPIASAYAELDDMCHAIVREVHEMQAELRKSRPNQRLLGRHEAAIYMQIDAVHRRQRV